MEKVSKTLDWHLERISSITKRLSQTDNPAIQIEVDILLGALRDMYEAAMALPVSTAEPAPAEEENTAQTPQDGNGMYTPLMVDSNAAPQYADDDDSENETAGTSQQIVDSENDLMFESVNDQQEPSAEHADEPAAPTTSETTHTEEPQQREQAQQASPVANAQANAPKTVWDKLQEQNSTTTIGEQIVHEKSIADSIAEQKAVNGTPLTNNTAGNTYTAHAPAEPAPATPAAPTAQALRNTTNAKPQQLGTTHQSSLFDYFKSPATAPITATVADRLEAQVRQNQQENKAGSHKVSDLRTIININDKFSFMSELFHNNMKGYNDFILRLNATATREEALDYVNGIAQQYNWDNDSLAVKTFFNIFDRKF